jgi:hypothetical protein
MIFNKIHFGLLLEKNNKKEDEQQQNHQQQGLNGQVFIGFGFVVHAAVDTNMGSRRVPVHPPDLPGL